MISLLSSPSPHLSTLRSVNYDANVLPVFESQNVAKKPKNKNGKRRVIGSKKLVVVAEEWSQKFFCDRTHPFS
jgi:hypothetical protein